MDAHNQNRYKISVPSSDLGSNDESSVVKDLTSCSSICLLFKSEAGDS